MELPQFLKSYEKEAKRYLDQNGINGAEFSGPTYQVQVYDAKTGSKIWAFIHLDEKGLIDDGFCSCDKEDEEGGCPHLAVAYLWIYHGFTEPLHLRFKRSLWNSLCRSCLGQKIREQNGLYIAKDFEGKGLAKKADQKLHQILLEPVAETEETSLKFSHLKNDELALWEAGKPSKELEYELSCWCDLAKWLMLKQERGDSYEIELRYNGLPNWIEIEFEELKIGFSLSEDNLPLVIPTLENVKSPLKVHRALGKALFKVRFDQKLYVKGSSNVEEVEGVSLPGWVFVKGKGFYEQAGLVGEQVLEGEEIGQFLTEHADQIQGLDPLVKNLSYTLNFDDQWNLHISGYLFKPGDIEHQFLDWVYLKSGSFYHIKKGPFNAFPIVVHSSEVSGFVNQYRSWLLKQKGFHPFQVHIESRLIYRLDDKGTLHFDSEQMGEKTHDFGMWFYVSDQGFFRKIRNGVGSPLHPGLVVEKEEIPYFIQMYQEELTSVKGFFAVHSPVKESGLSIYLNDREQIIVTPQHTIDQKKEIRFFENYAYVEREGFHLLPFSPKVPVEYYKEVVIPKKDVELFILFQLENLLSVALSVDPRLHFPKKMALIAHRLTRQEKHGKGWYDASLHYLTELGEVDALEILKVLERGGRFAFTAAGLLNLDERRFGWLHELKKRKRDLRLKQLRLSAIDLLKLQSFEELHPPSKRGKTFTKTRAILEELESFTTSIEPDLTGLKTKLRPYQYLGLKWLWFLYQHGLSGLLCDDMGLGKTHQAMALLAAVKNQEGKHFLVVCPTSVIYHWQDKLHTYFPKAKVLTFYGMKRSLKGFSKSYDILLTSYGIWRSESDLLSQVPFELAIFDEIQMAKNPSSKLHKALLKVKANVRIGLTGTPIENYLRELKSLFDIVLPEYMPGPKEYYNLFIKPIEKEGDKKKKELLSAYIRPFILRRKKEEVLKDLPSKTEEVSPCALLPQQYRLYHDVLAEMRPKLIDELNQEQIPYVHVFALLTKLKQVCDHPAVYYNAPKAYKKYQSGKWQLFVELLEEARDSGQKIVVFSQYLTQLDIIQNYLEENHIGYASIRGSTLDRGEQIRRFQEEEKCEVFVASLRAAGLGIDLTAASVVIHYDRWWNAARENQATDRVHRIGQTRGVQVFKMVTRGTFEERIHEMIARKGKLMEEVISSDEQDILKLFVRKEILELIKDVHYGRDDQVDFIED